MMDLEYVPTDPGNTYVSESIIRELFFFQTLCLSCKEPAREYSWNIVAGERLPKLISWS